MPHPLGTLAARYGRLGAVLAVVVWPCAVTAQDGPKFDTWTKAEASAEAREYLELIKGDDFDEQAKAFLERIALPQLGMAGNRKTIERVRRRIRDYALNERTAGADALEAANKAAATWLVALARKADAEAVVRVNAMLLVGELRAKDGRPWPGAAPLLAAAVADASLAPAVRVAAASGLARHVDVARASSTVDPALAQALGKPLVAVIAAPPTGDRAAGDWIVSRALDMLPVVAPKASPESAAALAKILDDANRTTDVRVRAAAALGATATAESKIDATRALTTIRGLAIAALRAERDAAAERALARQVGGPLAAGTQPQFANEFSGPGFPGAAAATPALPVEPLVVQRDAWRLATLAGAVKPVEGDRGLASLLPADRKPAAEELARALRTAAGSLEGTPDATGLKDAIDMLERAVPPAAPAAAPVAAPAAAPAGKPDAAAPKPTAPSATPEPSDPFAAPAN